MAHTYASVYIHCVFSTKERRPLIPANRTAELYAYLGGIARGEGLTLIAAGGTANHIHLLLVLPATCSLAHAVQKLKGSSSRWMGSGFSWQEGYGAFSVSPSQLEVVKHYIQNQEEHHRKRDFEQEFIALLRGCGIEYDEQFVFG
ncbi:IS200/IS605 family transposase [Acidicapsa dinghuensis]|uniref:IS200/IS605 family transposase n=1 Tax=Acidicapsa dinghuensis TaxID=2218256 RepID=A0ABW1EQK2_9BACT|nr:IS200/IS605 family transposase [Acidicapsa dinghuensis]